MEHGGGWHSRAHGFASSTGLSPFGARHRRVERPDMALTGHCRSVHRERCRHVPAVAATDASCPIILVGTRRGLVRRAPRERQRGGRPAHDRREAGNPPGARARPELDRCRCDVVPGIRGYWPLCSLRSQASTVLVGSTASRSTWTLTILPSLSTRKFTRRPVLRFSS